MGLEPHGEQNLPPSWRVLASHKWVTWHCEVSLRVDRLCWSLRKAGSNITPGTLHTVCRSSANGQPTLKFRVMASRGERSQMSKRWVLGEKRKTLNEIQKRSPEGTHNWWAKKLSEGKSSHVLSSAQKRWKGTMFPFKQTSWTKCPLCKNQWTNVHLALHCHHWQIVDIRTDALQTLGVAMLEHDLHSIPESCYARWQSQSDLEKLINLIQASTDTQNQGYWSLVDSTLSAAWDQMSQVLRFETEDYRISNPEVHQFH